jgi:hypothetical protein
MFNVFEVITFTRFNVISFLLVVKSNFIKGKMKEK